MPELFWLAAVDRLFCVGELDRSIMWMQPALNSVMWESSCCGYDLLFHPKVHV